MKYPKNYLEEIKLRLKVSQVVGKTVKLNRRGKEFVGLSPFTNEKHHMMRFTKVKWKILRY